MKLARVLMWVVLVTGTGCGGTAFTAAGADPDGGLATDSALDAAGQDSAVDGGNETSVDAAPETDPTVEASAHDASGCGSCPSGYSCSAGSVCTCDSPCASGCCAESYYCSAAASSCSRCVQAGDVCKGDGPGECCGGACFQGLCVACAGSGSTCNEAAGLTCCNGSTCLAGHCD